MRAAAWLALSMIIPILAVLVARWVFDVDQFEFVEIMKSLSSSPWALPITIALFCGLAFIGTPQWMLITGAVLAFGPWEGGAISWIGSLTAAMLGFCLGHFLGAERLRKIDAKLIRKLSAAVRRNGFMTSLVVRLVPTGPAILVNLTAGVSRMRFRHFVAGTAIGIIPKIIVVALISQGLISGLSGDILAVFFGSLAGVAIFLSWTARKRLEARSPI